MTLLHIYTLSPLKPRRGRPRSLMWKLTESGCCRAAARGSPAPLHQWGRRSDRREGVRRPVSAPRSASASPPQAAGQPCSGPGYTCLKKYHQQWMKTVMTEEMLQVRSHLHTVTLVPVGGCSWVDRTLLRCPWRKATASWTSAGTWAQSTTTRVRSACSTLDKEKKQLTASAFDSIPGAQLAQPYLSVKVLSHLHSSSFKLY